MKSLIPIVKLVDIFVHVDFFIDFAGVLLMLAFAAMAFAIAAMPTDALHFFIIIGIILCVHILNPTINSALSSSTRALFCEDNSFAVTS